jgi:hypothetical protein
MKQRILLVAPYVGEFGWELMNWHGRIRHLARSGRYDRIIVAAPADRQALFRADEDKAITLHPINLPTLPGMASEDHRITADGQRVPCKAIRFIFSRILRSVATARDLNPAEIEFMLPDLNGQLWPTAPSDQVFTDLRIQGPATTDVLLIPRRRDMAIERNQPDRWWDELEARFNDNGLRVERYADGLYAAIAQLSRTRLAIGASTGGLHLASLCRCPHYVWGCDSSLRWTALRMSNRQRYETFWNPLGTPVIYDEVGWRPDVDYVVKQTCRALERIGLARGRSETHSPSMNWRVRRGLARVVETGAAWPWRVRQLVHEALL